MGPMDLLKFNQCNLDHLTETYNINFYLEYFTKWPQLCLVLEDKHGQIEGYSECDPLPSLLLDQTTHSGPQTPTNANTKRQS